MVERGIEPETSWLVVRSSDHQATRLVPFFNILKVKMLYAYFVVAILSTCPAYDSLSILKALGDLSESSSLCDTLHY